VMRTAAATEQLQKLWSALVAGPRALTQKEVVALGGLLYRAFVEAFEEEPRDAEKWHRSFALNQLALQGKYGASQLAIATNDEKVRAALEARFGGLVDALLMKQGLVVDPPTRFKLLQEAARQLSAASDRLSRNAEGDYSPDTHANTLPQWQSGGGKALPSISGLFADWCARVVPAKGVAKSTEKGYRHTFTAFIAFLGHDKFEKLDDTSVIRYAEYRVASGTNPRTVNEGDLSALKSVFGWGAKSKRIPFNPAQGVRVPEGKKLRLRERGFSDDEAAAILKASLAYQKTPQESVEVAAAKKWVPWLCAFTGARVGEMVQLHRKHVTQHKAGYWQVRITPDDGGSVKTKSFRTVPLHPQLEELGFIEFVKSRSEGPLFAKPGKRSSRGGVKNRLQEFTRKIVQDPNVQPNHGWRHRFITQARRYHLSDERRRMITGHVGKSVDETDYGDAAGLYEEICKLPKVDLT